MALRWQPDSPTDDKSLNPRRSGENETTYPAGSNWMRDAELRYLTELVMPADAVEPFGAYLFRGDEPGAELGRHVERAVFLEAFGNTPELLAEEYGPYEASSVFICVVDQLPQAPGRRHARAARRRPRGSRA